jgi:L,D-transpeptidase catalytic domain
VNAHPKLVAVFLFLLVAALAACLPAAARAAEQPALTLTAAPAMLTYGATTTLTARGAPAGTTLTLSRKQAGEADFSVVDTGTADAGGVASWTRKPAQSAAFRVDVLAGDTSVAAAEVAVGVSPKVSLAAAARRPLHEQQRVRYTVTVRPPHPGAAVQLQRWTADGWVALADLTLDADSKASVSLLAGAPGRLVVRASIAADAEHLAGHSASWKRTVYDHRNPYGVPTKYPHLILVDLSQYKLYYHEFGHVVRVFACVLGRPSLPTPRGHFKIYAKDPHMGGPYGPFRMRYLGLYAIHGTNEPWLLARYPRNYSHGCTRLANANITWLYSKVHVGTPVWNVP